MAGRAASVAGAAAGRRAAIARLAVHALALAPLILLAFDAVRGNLSVNPIEDVTLRTGKPALMLLVASLAITPANTVFGWRWSIPMRRTLGLYAFGYALLHFLVFVVLDYGLDPVLLQEAIFEKPYALVGFSAFVTLTPLALTSTKAWQRRLGRRWRSLHRLVYVAAVLVVVHYVWLVKSDYRQPLVWGAAIAILLALRVPSVRTAISRRRHNRTRARPPIPVPAAPQPAEPFTAVPKPTADTPGA